MKKLLLFAIIGLVTISCVNKEEKKKNIEGKEIISRYTNGTAEIEREYKIIDGKRAAVYEWEYYEDGNKLKEGALSKNEKRDGNWKAYYRDGKLWSEGDYSDGVRQGKTITYHSNGNLYYIGKFNKAQKSGIWKFYDENGEFDYDIDYDKRATPKISIDSSEFKNAINK